MLPEDYEDARLVLLSECRNELPGDSRESHDEIVTMLARYRKPTYQFFDELVETSHTLVERGHSIEGAVHCALLEGWSWYGGVSNKDIPGNDDDVL